MLYIFFLSKPIGSLYLSRNFPILSKWQNIFFKVVCNIYLLSFNECKIYAVSHALCRLSSPGVFFVGKFSLLIQISNCLLTCLYFLFVLIQSQETVHFLELVYFSQVILFTSLILCFSLCYFWVSSSFSSSFKFKVRLFRFFFFPDVGILLLLTSLLQRLSLFVSQILDPFVVFFTCLHVLFCFVFNFVFDFFSNLSVVQQYTVQPLHVCVFCRFFFSLIVEF